jgi:hypothetical protein
MRARPTAVSLPETKKVAEEIVFPGTLNILGKRWPVEWVVNPDDFSDSEDGDGETVFRTQTIRVKENQPFDAERDTVIHEILHALDNTLRLGLRHKQVYRLAAALYQLMRANPDLVAYIMAAHPEETP